MTTAVPVAFVGGHGRSGSTLLSRVLGAVPGFVTVGELCYLWDQGVVMDRMCGCGKPFSGASSDRGRQGARSAAGTRLTRGGCSRCASPSSGSATRRCCRLRPVPDVRPASCGSTRRRCPRSTRRSGRSAARRWSWTPRSTRPRRTCCGTCRTSISKLVHLVRSVYGVCYSWMKTVARPDRDGKPMPRYPPARDRGGVVGVQLPARRAAAAGRADEARALRGLRRRRRGRSWPAIVRFLGRSRPEQTWRSWGSPASSCPATTASPETRCGSGPGRSSCGWTRPGGPARPATRRLISVVSGPAILRYGYASDVRHPAGAAH